MLVDMQVVKAQRVKDYEQYVSALRLSKTMQQHMALFLAKLGGTTTARGIEHLCIEEKGWFEQQYRTTTHGRRT